MVFGGGAIRDVAKRAKKVVEDNVRRGQVVKLLEEEVKRMYPRLVIAYLRANRKEKERWSDDGPGTARRTLRSRSELEDQRPDQEGFWA